MRLHMIVGLGLVALALALDVSAQTPRVVRHSGVVRDAAGQVRTGAATLTFALYAEAEGGAPLWVEVQAVTLDSQGRYAVALGATQAEGLPLELFTSGAARWLGVTVDGGPELPRVALLSVPYALQAADATTIGGKPLSAFVLAGDKTGTGADGLTYVNLPQVPGAAGEVTPQASSGTPGYLGVFTNSTDLGNSVVFQNGSSIGVNTITPAAGFHAVASAAPGAFFDVYSDMLGALPVVYRAARGTPGAPLAVQADDILGGLAVRGYGTTGFSGGQGQVMFRTAENWTDAAHGTYLQLTTTPLGSASWVERMRITPAGNVGIGTTTPGQKLSVAGTIESTTGGFRFPDGSVQTMAAKSDTVNHNSAFGYLSLVNNTTGNGNSALGSYALHMNTAGPGNAAVGYQSLAANTTGPYNAAVGYQSLAANTEGGGNAAFGAYSLWKNTTGGSNAAFGNGSLLNNTTGYNNAAFGASSLYRNVGSNNIAIGTGAGYNLTTGSNNIHIGHQGYATEDSTIRIGTYWQTRTFIAGIRGVTTGLQDAVPVLIDNTGQLGTVSSSRRVKDDIADMGMASRALMQLRPVTFHYKSDQDPSGRTLQYGLIAEEVAEVYPGLVARSADDQIETVLYQFLPPMLLNEYQRQQRTIEGLQAQNETLRAQLAALTDRLARLEARDRH